MKCLRTRDLFSYEEGELSPEHTAAVSKHLEICSACNESAKEMAETTGRLSPDADEFEDSEFASDVMTLIRLGQSSPEKLAPPRRPKKLVRILPIAALPLAAAAAVLIFINPFETPGNDPALFPHNEFTPRSAGNPDVVRWTSFEILEQMGNKLSPVKGPIRTDSSVAFTYTNGSPTPFTHLMILAVDEQGDIYWYYPAYEEEGTNPQSISISIGEEPLSLPDAVRHDLQPGPLTFAGIFSTEPLDVVSLESMIQRLPQSRNKTASLGGLDPGPGTLVQTTTLNVISTEPVGR